MQVRYQAAPRSEPIILLEDPKGARGEVAARHLEIIRSLETQALQVQRRRILISSSSSTRTCLTICWLCDTSVRASSPVSLLRAPPMVKP